MVMSVYGGMGDTGLRDRLPALWRRIEDAHYSYLETDDSPEKLQQKKKLEGYIIEYLSLVPQECKFGVPETAKVFQRSINELPEFSAYRAGLGWAALGRYAANLLTQPWRKEYKVIRLYSGYYKHEVEANLVGAETLLLAMGYKPVGAGKLALDAPVCPDMVAAISRDALIAQCECQIMAEIWENAWSSGARVTWAEVLQARAGRGLTVPITATTIAYGDGSEIYSNVSDTISPGHHSHTRIEARHHNNILPQSNRLCSNGLHLEEPVNHIHTSYVMSPNMLPPQLVYEIPPHMHSEVPLAVPQCNPIPMIPTYGAVPYYYSVQTPYIVPTPVYAPVKHAATIPVNGYSPIPQYRYPTVPTGQLIELDTSLCENRKHERHSREDERNLRKSKHDENLRRNSTSKSGLSDVSLPSVPRSDTQPMLSKAREDGMGTYESWDYVFRNLSSKDQDGDRSRFSPSLDRDSRTLDRLNKEERRTKYQPTTLDLEDGMQALNLDRSQDEDAYRTAKVNENLMRLKQEQEAKRVKQLAKKQADDKRITKVVDPVLNPSSDGLINHKVAPDKVRLLSKKEVKDRKDIIKQQNGAVHNTVEIKKVKKPLKLAAVDLEKPSRSKPLENGVHTGHTLKSSVATNTVKPSQEINPQLIVTLDETDSIRRTTKTQPSDRERSISRTSHVSDRQRNNDCDSVMNKDKWECATCTFLNKVSLQACEMCGKSKKGPEIQPLTSGGRECPACTLVNKRDAISCDACGTSLEHCPTYI